MNLLIFLLSILFVLWLICLLNAIHYGKVGRLSRKQSRLFAGGAVPSVSIIMAVEENCEQLKRCLPLILEQYYDGDYEVIVVDRQSTDNTLEYLRELEETYPHLHHSSCPASARDISIQRLALTLGAKAAGYDWLVFLHPDCQVPSAQWLQSLAVACTDEVDAVLGASIIVPRGRWRVRRMQFQRLLRETIWLPGALKHVPCHVDANCLCYRRSHFLSHQGFASAALLSVGAEELLVNHNVAAGRCGVNVSPAAIVQQEAPSSRIWRRERLFQVEINRHLHHDFWPRQRYVLLLVAETLFPLTALAVMFHLWPQWQIPAVVLSLWFVLIVVRLVMLYQTTHALGLPCYILRLPFLRYSLPWSDFSFWLSWCLSDKRVFRKKFV